MNRSIETYKVFSNFYDLYVGKFDADFDFYKSYCSKTDKILEIGCGTGRILNVLLNSDCKVTGVDISQEMLEKARAKFINQLDDGQLSLINHNFISDKLNDSFDKILLSFYTFNYILDLPIDFLKNVHNSLNDNGMLLMDLFYPKALYDQSINGKWLDKEYNINGYLIKIRDCRTMDKDIEYRQQIFIIDETETKIDTQRKYYSPSSLKEIFKTAGFQDVEFSYDYDYKGFEEMINETKLKSNYVVKVKK